MPDNNSDILECFDEIDWAIDEIVAWHTPKAAPSAADIADFRDNMRSLISTGGNPAQYFHILGHGAFKACYEGLGDWIVKFCTEENATAAEEELLDLANEAHLGWLFTKTIIIPLPRLLETNIPDLTPYNTDESTPVFNAIQMQPRVTIAANHGFRRVPDHAATYNINPVRFNNGDMVPHSILMDFGITDCTWVKSFIENYGDSNFNLFCVFAKEYGLSDLHSENLGYIVTEHGDLPIILDWLSLT